jgi:hypothetical protein
MGPTTEELTHDCKVVPEFNDPPAREQLSRLAGVLKQVVSQEFFLAPYIPCIEPWNKNGIVHQPMRLRAT